MVKIKYRVENKYIVTESLLKILEHRLKNIMKCDIHQKDDSYTVKSLYFDDVFNTCLESNEAGINDRKKYRIRTYDNGVDSLNLEVKEKRNGFTHKNICPITIEEYKKILKNEFFVCSDRAPLNELFLQNRLNKMGPVIIIEYERTAFVHNSGNVRITFDRNIRVNHNVSCFLKDSSIGLLPVLPSGLHILEVKYDEFLPDVIYEQLELKNLKQTPFSKFYYGRLLRS